MMKTGNLIKLLLAALVLVAVTKLILNKSRAAMANYRASKIVGYSFPESYDAEEEEETFGEEEEAETETFGEEEEEETYGEDYDDAETYGEDNDDTETYDPMPAGGVATNRIGISSQQRSDNWSLFAPKNALSSENFLDASKYIGVDTQGSSLRNASHDLRNNIIIPKPKQPISPWLQSDIDADMSRNSIF